MIPVNGASFGLETVKMTKTISPMATAHYQRQMVSVLAQP
jgi:hypothetical protein